MKLMHHANPLSNWLLERDEKRRKMTWTVVMGLADEG
jgi:hypothetical protein